MRSVPDDSPAIDDVSVQPVLLVLSAVLIPILLGASLMLYILPDVGIDRFAWPLRPLMSSMMLGATYLGGASFFMIVLISRRWRHVWLGFLPIAAFAGTLGIATLIHWENFVHERWGFWVWVVLYFGVPVILPILWYLNHRLAAGVQLAREGELPSSIRVILGVLGVVLTSAAVLLFIVPDLMIPTWPWDLTPLTSRIMSSMFILPGLVGMAVAWDGSWASSRYLLKTKAITVALMLIAIVVARADLDWSYPTSWIFTGGMAGILLLIAYIHYVMRDQ
ncbi:MAG: hypothetical protein EA415_12425 [Sphaerobacteraceae bacterium]|nr:MAG: hypothetical protein EA415_12425 [Sphaerobacteraceae bacterium]